MTDDAYLYREARPFTQGTVNNPYSTLCMHHLAPVVTTTTAEPVTEPSDSWLIDSPGPGDANNPDSGQTPSVSPPDAAVQQPTEPLTESPTQQQPTDPQSPTAPGTQSSGTSHGNDENPDDETSEPGSYVQEWIAG